MDGAEIDEREKSHWEEALEVYPALANLGLSPQVTQLLQDRRRDLEHSVSRIRAHDEKEEERFVISFNSSQPAKAVQDLLRGGLTPEELGRLLYKLAMEHSAFRPNVDREVLSQTLLADFDIDEKAERRALDVDGSMGGAEHSRC